MPSFYRGLLVTLTMWRRHALSVALTLTTHQRRVLAVLLRNTASHLNPTSQRHTLQEWRFLAERLRQSEAASADDLAALIEGLLDPLTGLQGLHAMPMPNDPEQRFYPALVEEVLDQLVPLIFHLTGVGQKGWHEALRWHVMHEELALLRQLGYPNTDIDEPVE